MVFLSSEFLLSLLILTIVFFFVYKTMFKQLKNKIVAFTIAISASLLSIYFLLYSESRFVYRAFGYTGVVISMLVPTAILFYILYKSRIPSSLRKIFWILYSALLIYMIQFNDFFPQRDYTNLVYIIIIATITILFLVNIIKEKILTTHHLRRR